MARKEYRDGLREKWGSVAEVAKLERCVLPPPPLLFAMITEALWGDAVNGSSRNRFTTPRRCAGPCWMRGRRRRRTGGRTRPRESMRSSSGPNRRGSWRFSASRARGACWDVGLGCAQYEGVVPRRLREQVGDFGPLCSSILASSELRLNAFSGGGTPPRARRTPSCQSRGFRHRSNRSLPF